MSSFTSEIQNEYVQLYLEYVEETESPRIYHVWAALSGISGCLGRRVKFPFGSQEIFANSYISLIGPPATRKSTTINIAEKLLKASTSIRFAPDDTSGQRQGLISAMEGWQDELDAAEINGSQNDLNAAISEIDLEAIGESSMNMSLVDRHVMYASADELMSLFGDNSRSMLRFLIKAWNGDDYRYKLKKEELILSEPLLTIFGATTPTEIINSMPPEAIGQGLMSRIILVFANKKYKEIPRPKPLPQDLEDRLKKLYGQIYHEMEGDMDLSPAADKLLDELYKYQTKINDMRFSYYEERRQVHLLKCAMWLAASRLSLQIEEVDLRDAHRILCYTETFMSEALGEFGMSPVAASKHKILEYLQHCKRPIPASVLWSFMHRDMRSVDFANAMMDMCNTGKVLQITDKETKEPAYVYRDRERNVTEALDALGV